MRLRLFTGAAIVLCFGLLFSYPWLVGRRPRGHVSRAAVKAYSLRATAYVGGLLVTLIASGAGSFFIIRKARDEYRVHAVENMRQLLEATRQDHLKKGGRDREG